MGVRMWGVFSSEFSLLPPPFYGGRCTELLAPLSAPSPAAARAPHLSGGVRAAGEAAGEEQIGGLGLAADVRADRVPHLRGRRSGRGLRDPALQLDGVDFDGGHRGHLSGGGHQDRFLPAVRVHPGEERVRGEDRDDGAGDHGGGPQRRARLRVVLRRELLRAEEEPGQPAAGCRAPPPAVGREVRGGAPVRGLRLRRLRRGGGGGTIREPRRLRVGRRRRQGPRRRPRRRLHRRPVQLPLRVHRPGQRDLDVPRPPGGHKVQPVDH